MTTFIPPVIIEIYNAAARGYIVETGVSDGACGCDWNTEPIASQLLAPERYVFPGDAMADPERRCRKRAAAKPIGQRLAPALSMTLCSVTVRHHLFHCPAPNVDGFVSGVAAMTVGGQKITFEAVPPLALFAEPSIFMSAPPELVAAGVGDMLGKYISLFDWKVSSVVTGERFDGDIYMLERDALEKVVSSEPGSPDFGVLLMRALVASGLAMQAYGSSRPASGSEHHLSHLWEMHCINEPVSALHGEKVGVATLILLASENRRPVLRKIYTSESIFCGVRQADRRDNSKIC